MSAEKKSEASAANGLLHRRRLLQGGLLIAGTSVASKSLAEAKPWQLEPGEPFSNYGQPSPYQKQMIRWITANSAVPGNGVSWTPLHDMAGTITPNGLHFERHHNGVPQIDPVQHELNITGLVGRPLKFSVNALHRYPMRSRICFIECGGNSNTGWLPQPMQSKAGYLHGLVSCSEWTGVPLASLLDEADLKTEAKWIIATGADAAGVSVSLPIEKALDDVIVALYQNGEYVRPENGFPLRLVTPGWEGITNVKWLSSLLVSEKPLQSRYETSKYTDLHKDGSARQFTFEMKAKSLITSPSPGKSLQQQGLYEISGLAWSGAGKIKKVEVSADAGNSWSEAELQEPVLSKSLTRFRVPWEWSGQEAVLQSRATDETGYAQPTRASLIKAQGENAYYHYNAIVSWQVDDWGDITHVYA